jgi:hypothetical protein
VRCCQCEPFEITVDNDFGVRTLADIWAIPDLRLATEKFISHPLRGNSLLVPALIDGVRRSADTSDLETTIRDRFFELLSDVPLFSVPLSVLERIVHYNSGSERSCDLFTLT